MNFNNKLVDKFLNAVFPLPENFGVVLSNTDVEPPFEYSMIKRKIQYIDNKAELNFGMSKMIITSPNLGDVVIKIPFNGYFENDDKLDWYDFTNAAGSNPSNYCLTELEKYQELKKHKLNCFVAKTFPYKTINNILILLQEYVITNKNFYSNSKPSYSSIKLVEKWCDEGQAHVNIYWLADCIDKYGEEKVKQFLYYCNYIDLDILEDFHTSNYGYRKNGTPAILDFSNFKEYC